MPFEKLEEKRMYVRAEEIADSVWELVGSWSRFAQNTIGDQFVTAADSIGANISEAGGRYHPNDVKKFLYYARGSLRETVYWVRRATKRGLLEAARAVAMSGELEQLSRELNGAIAFQKRRGQS